MWLSNVVENYVIVGGGGVGGEVLYFIMVGVVNSPTPTPG